MKKIVFILLVCIVLFESIFLINQAKKLKEYKDDVSHASANILFETVREIVYVQNRLDKCKLDSSLDYNDLDRIQSIYKNFDKNKQAINELHNAGRTSDTESYGYTYKHRVSEIIDPIKNRIKSGKEPFQIEPPEELIKTNMLFINILIKNKMVYYNKENSLYESCNFDYNFETIKNDTLIFNIFKEFLTEVSDMYDYNKD